MFLGHKCGQRFPAVDLLDGMAVITLIFRVESSKLDAVLSSMPPSDIPVSSNGQGFVS